FSREDWSLWRRVASHWQKSKDAVACGSAVSPSSGGARRAWTIRWSTSSGQSRRTSSWLITRQERKVLSQLQTMSKKDVEEEDRGDREGRGARTRAVEYQGHRRSVL